MKGSLHHAFSSFKIIHKVYIGRVEKVGSGSHMVVAPCVNGPCAGRNDNVSGQKRDFPCTTTFNSWHPLRCKPRDSSANITGRLRFRDSTTRQSEPTMDDILDQARDAVEAPIVRHSRRPSIPLTLRPQDFEGQRLATSVNYVLLSGFGVRRSPRARCSPVARSQADSNPLRSSRFLLASSQRTSTTRCTSDSQGWSWRCSQSCRRGRFTISARYSGCRPREGHGSGRASRRRRIEGEALHYMYDIGRSGWRMTNGIMSIA
jgi:hypothetical protein